MKRLIFILLFISTLSYAQHEHRTGLDSISWERLMLRQNLNEARENPQTYGKHFHDSLRVDLSMYESMDSLQFDQLLTVYAQWYAEMLLYQAPVFKHSSMPYEESILWNYDICVSIDQFILSDGHRQHMLDASNTKIGIGITKGWVGKWYRTYVVILTD